MCLPCSKYRVKIRFQMLRKYEFFDQFGDTFGTDLDNFWYTLPTIGVKWVPARMASKSIDFAFILGSKREMQDHARSCKIMQDHARSCKIGGG